MLRFPEVRPTWMGDLVLNMNKNRLKGPAALYTFSLPMCVLNVSTLIHLNNYTKWNMVEIDQAVCDSWIKHNRFFQSGINLFLTWRRKQIRLIPRNSLSAQRETLVHITCIVHDLCTHPCPHPNQRGSVQCNLCQGFGKYCSLPHQMFLSLNKNWSPAKGSKSCLLRCFPQIHTECCHHHGAILAKISSLFFHNT